MDIKEILKAKLKNTRKLKRLTQEQVAELAGIEVNYYGTVENGKNIPSVKTLMKLAEILDFTVDDLIRPDKKPAVYHTLVDLLNQCDEKELRILLGTLHALLENR